MENKKKLVNLTIPLESFFKSGRTDFHPEKEFDENGMLTLVFCESEITGNLKDGTFYISDIDISGEGSGYDMNEVIEPALKDSTGELIASRVWEGGDSINQIIVKDGKVEWRDIEI
ncbi:hypothetical protein LCGC14_3062380 [marine sediment metagenome]|uniref:Uncharacterized protein n=1 Tax=marine sediment metagenome TaxID=412755 RepID=A0A0F8X6S2_9ZZZZ|nr:hypothetical protein [Desulfobacterales bacterium]